MRATLCSIAMAAGMLAAVGQPALRAGGSPRRLVNTGHLPATLFIVLAAPHPPRALTKPELDSIARRHHVTFP